MHERQPELERAIGGGAATQYSMRSPASLEALRAERGPVGHPLAADACVRMRRAVRADGVLGDARSQVVDDPGHNGEGRHRAALLPAPAARRPQEVQDGCACLLGVVGSACCTLLRLFFCIAPDFVCRALVA
jgi:hypothetical protein